MAMLPTVFVIDDEVHSQEGIRRTVDEEFNVLLLCLHGKYPFSCPLGVFSNTLIIIELFPSILHYTMPRSAIGQSETIGACAKY